jgi:ferredoxin-NADP reductase
MLAEAGIDAERDPRVFVCAPTPVVETIATLLVDAGHEPHRIHAECFGPTGGS